MEVPAGTLGLDGRTEREGGQGPGGGGGGALTSQLDGGCRWGVKT